MTRSRFGRAETGDDDGPWQHNWNGTAFKVEPNPDPQSPVVDTHPRNPVGGMCCNAADMGRFLAESVRPDPKVFRDDTLRYMQSNQVSAASSFTSGAWASDEPGSKTTHIWYEGDNGSMLAAVNAWLSTRTAMGVMCNMNDLFATPAIVDMQSTLQAFNSHWGELFAADAPEPLECVHAMPALVATGNFGEILTVFARKRDGRLIRRQSTDSGQTWGPEIPLGEWIMTSGLAAAATPDGSHMFLFGRGTDNQIWFGKSSDGGQNWQGASSVPFGTFMTGPAVAVSVKGSSIGIHLVAIGMDRRMYYIHSTDGGQSWSKTVPIGSGVFTSAPAIIASQDGNLVRVFARGDDFRLWTNSASPTWEPHWEPIGQGLFTSSPAAIASDNGALVHVMARGTDGNLWRNFTTGFNTPFQAHWQALSPAGSPVAAPAMAIHGVKQYIAAIGSDFTLYVNHSTDAGGSWAGFSQIGPNPGLFI